MSLELNQIEVKDPVCGMTVKPETAKGGSSVFQDKTYYFCNPKCKTKFDQNPKLYLAPTKIAAEKPDVEYTCPMHPEVRQIGPGSCPKCGMALEPVTASLDNHEDKEYSQMLNRFWVSMTLSIPLLFLTMGGRMLFPMALQHNMKWVEVILATPVVLWGGGPFFIRLVKKVKKRIPNILTRNGLGVGKA
jgi:P-type Cu+ transporter